MLQQPHTAASNNAVSPASSATSWALCPNCQRLLPANAPECVHCHALFGDALGWQLQPLPGRVPSPAERAALATAADRHAARVQATQARLADKAAPSGPISRAEQLLRTTGCLVLERTDTAAEADAALGFAMLATAVLLVPALLLSSWATLALCALICMLLVSAQTGREQALQRRVTLDMANAQLTVDMHWPRQERSLHRIVPTQDLAVVVERGVLYEEDSSAPPWLLVLVLPPDSEDPGSAHIQLACLPSADAQAAWALRARLAAHLGVQADGQVPE